jgi:hypothetical protein
MTRAALLVLLAACSEAIPEDGLVLDTVDADQVSGTFASGGAGLRFAFTRAGDTRHMTLSDADGRLLADSTREGTIETTHILGRLTIVGSPDQLEPAITGDREALNELRESAAGQLLAGLRVALDDAGIDRALFSDYSKQQQQQDAYQKTYVGTLYCGQSLYVPTWSLWGQVTIYVGKNNAVWEQTKVLVATVTDHMHPLFPIVYTVRVPSGQWGARAQGMCQTTGGCGYWFDWSVSVQNTCAESSSLMHISRETY